MNNKRTCISNKRKTPEEALAYYQLMNEFSLTQEEVAKKIGKERSTIANFLRILKLPREVVQYLQREEISFGHAKVLAAVKDDEGKRYPRSVLYFKTAEDEGKLHPTQKPIALYEYLVKTYSNEGDTILDPCMGSGTTGVACMNTNRNFIGIERDREYYQVAHNRLNNPIYNAMV